MKRAFVLTIMMLIVPGVGLAQSANSDPSILKPIKNDAYGPGVHSDATGKPVEWRTQNDDTKIAPGTSVKQDAYGLGVGMDVYGRPVVLKGTNR